MATKKAESTRGAKVGEAIRGELMKMLLAGEVHDPGVQKTVISSVVLTADLRLSLFRPYRGDPWPQGVQEDDEVHWQLTAPGTTARPVAGETMTPSEIDAAVDEEDVREHVAIVSQFAEAPGHDFSDAGVIVDAFDIADAKAAVARLEWQAINELHKAGDRFVAAQVCDVDTFDIARLRRQLENLL